MLRDALSCSAVILAAMLSTYSPVSTAAIVVVDFDDIGARAIDTRNYESKGFMFSPNCHIDSYLGLLGFDSAGCHEVFNPDFRGPIELAGPQSPASGGKLFVEYLDGHPFTLLGLSMATDVSIASSKGGFFYATIPSPDFSPNPYDFSGPQWTGIRWLLLTGGTGDTLEIDNAIFRVSEPPTYVLLSALLLFLLRSGRRTA